MNAKLFWALTLLAATSELTYAHHSLVANYYFDRTVTVEGKVNEFLLRNPHSFVRVEGANGARPIEMWLMEWSSGGQLGRAGVSRDTLKPGDHVTVTGNPSRNPSERKLHVITILRPADGWQWNSGDQ
jgi:hypothetical protein